MNTENTESILSQWFRRVWTEEDTSAIDELAAADGISHGLIETIVGLDTWRKHFYQPMRLALSSVKVKVLEEFTVGDKIFARLEAELVPRLSGKPVTMSGMNMMRIANGKIVESWDTWDFLSVIESMKLLPAGSFGLAVTGALTQHPMLAS